MGTAQRPGTGVLPRILAWCLMGSGLLLAIQATLQRGRNSTPGRGGPLIMITLATIAFAFLVDRRTGGRDDRVDDAGGARNA